MVKTKLIATVGPACDSEPLLGEMIDAGVNVFRLNFSHGTLEGHEATLARIRGMAANRNAVIGVMGDLCGPKIRLGHVAGGKCELEAGQEVIFQRAETEGTPQRLWSSYLELIDDVDEGERVLIDDGSVWLRVLSKSSDELRCQCEVGGVVSDRKGINLPDSKVSAPAITEKDRVDLDWAIRHRLDFLALSFVRKPADIQQLRDILDHHESSIRIIAKIEKPEALSHLDEIIALSDGIMVARGDLGVEMELSRVPVVQKEIALHCQRAGKPVIIATQMLQSMVNSLIPTRAEVSDVANAILDRADAVMLSAETAVGQYPTQAVSQMRQVAVHAEAFDARFGETLGANQSTHVPVVSAVVHGASVTARDLKPPLVAVWTRQGKTAILLSKHRLDVPILALAPSEQVCRQLSLVYGVIPVHMRHADEFLEMLGDLDRLLLEKALAARDDKVIVVADTRPDVPGETDALFIHVVGSIEQQ